MGQAGARGAYAISWAQVRVDGHADVAPADLLPGNELVWTGEATRLDGPPDILHLGPFEGRDDLHLRAAQARLKRKGQVPAKTPEGEDVPPGLVQLTDARATYDIAVLNAHGPRPVVLFQGAPPPRDAALWVTHQTISAHGHEREPTPLVGVSAGTMMQTVRGWRDVATLRAGDVMRRAEGGHSPLLWIGRQTLTPALMRATGKGSPIVIRAGALGRGTPGVDLRLAPDQRVVVRGQRVSALFNTDAVTIAARDMVNDRDIYSDVPTGGVTYLQMLVDGNAPLLAQGAHLSPSLDGVVLPDDVERHRRASFGGARPLSRAEAAVLLHIL